MRENHRILVVDDEPEVRDALATLLGDGGYQVSIAENGFDALLQLRLATPDVIISDLNMPQMSGFELLSVVRRRFPSIQVLAKSDAYECSHRFPGGVIADAFFSMDRCQPDDLLSVVGELIQRLATRPPGEEHQPARIQMPRYGTDAQGASFTLLTCTDCLRTFSTNQTQEDGPEIQQANCQFCATAVRYVRGFPPRIVRHPMVAARQAVAGSTYCN